MNFITWEPNIFGKNDDIGERVLPDHPNSFQTHGSCFSPFQRELQGCKGSFGVPPVQDFVINEILISTISPSILLS